MMHLQTSLIYDMPTLAQLDGNDRYTPAPIIAAARATLGAIELDPASSAAANTVVQAERFYTKADDGLQQPWAGRVWLNPPFSDPTPWIEKLLAAHVVGVVPAALLLLRCDFGTSDHQRLDGPICTLRRSVANFWRPDKDRSSADQSHVVYYFGSDLAAFHQAFKLLGNVRPGVLL